MIRPKSDFIMIIKQLDQVNVTKIICSWLQWESFKAALHLSAKPSKMQRPVRAKVMSPEKLASGSGTQEISASRGNIRRADTFLLTDHTPATLAEQLTLMEQVKHNHRHTPYYMNISVLSFEIIVLVERHVH